MQGFQGLDGLDGIPGLNGTKGEKGSMVSKLTTETESESEIYFIDRFIMKYKQIRLQHVQLEPCTTIFKTK